MTTTPDASGPIAILWSEIQDAARLVRALITQSEADGWEQAGEPAKMLGPLGMTELRRGIALRLITAVSTGAQQMVMLSQGHAKAG